MAAASFSPSVSENNEIGTFQLAAGSVRPEPLQAPKLGLPRRLHPGLLTGGQRACYRCPHGASAWFLSAVSGLVLRSLVGDFNIRVMLKVTPFNHH